VAVALQRRPCPSCHRNVLKPAWSPRSRSATQPSRTRTDAHTSEIVKRWGAAAGALDKDRDLIADFAKAGFAYAPDKAALDKIDGRCGTRRNGVNGAVVDDYGFPDQPMPSSSEPVRTAPWSAS
jgi:alkaline phosphatase